MEYKALPKGISDFKLLKDSKFYFVDKDDKLNKLSLCAKRLDLPLYLIIDEGEAPENLIDPNTKTDYEKMKQLLKLDTKAAERGSVLLKIAQTGYSYGTIADSFPAEQLLDPQNFLSLLYYYGMLAYTLVDDNCVMAIPNNNVRKQYYDYLQSEYNKMQVKGTSLLRAEEV